MSSTELEVIQSPDEVLAALQGGNLPAIEDPAEVNRRIMAQILDAENVEDVFGDDDLVKTEAIAGDPITVTGLRVMRSRIRDTEVPVFMVVDAHRVGQARTFKITTSATKVMAKLAKLYQLDAFPIDVVIRRSDEPTASGYYFYDLERAPGGEA